MKIYENQFVKFRVGKRDYRRRCVGNLFAVGLDDAGRNDEHDRKYGSYRYLQSSGIVQTNSEQITHTTAAVIALANAKI